MEERFKFWRVNEITGTFVLVVIAVLISPNETERESAVNAGCRNVGGDFPAAAGD
jgi:hypothetical protein